MRIGSYKVADELLGDSDKRVLPGKDTFLIEVNNPFDDDPDAECAIAVQYSGTNVVTYLPDGGVIYYHGGWMTRTTQNRMADWGLSNVRIFKEGSAFFVSLPGETTPIEWDGYAVLVRPVATGGAVVEQLPALTL